MSTELAVTEPEILEPGKRTLRELVDGASREYALARKAGASLVEHAIRCGEMLLLAEAQHMERRLRGAGEGGTWVAFLDEHFPGGSSKAYVCMRMARYQDKIREGGFHSLTSADAYLTEVAAGRKPSASRPPDWAIDEMRRLRAEGRTLRAIGERVGLSMYAVRFWSRDPAAQEEIRVKEKERARLRNAAAKDAAKALKAQRHVEAVKRAVRKAGAAEQELYAMAERMQDIMGQAHREATDREKRRHYSLAGEHYRKMRDEIVRALGVS